jgi:hypothetical protein
VLKVVAGDPELFDDIPESELDDQRMRMQGIQDRSSERFQIADRLKV